MSGENQVLEPIPTSAWLQRNYTGPYSATDIIIRHNNGKFVGTVLIERLNEPYGIAFPGGIVDCIPKPFNARKEAKEETGLETILDDPLRPFLSLSGLHDDPRDYISTEVYTAEGSGIIRPDPKEDAKRAFSVNNDELYALTQKAGKWAMERHRRVAVIYLADFLGYEKALSESLDIKRQIIKEYKV
jgi:8-oxo-dGTP diphosphatase